MKLRPFLQYVGLTLINCVEIHTVNYLDAELAALLSFTMVSLTWCVYLEFAVGGILFRPDSQNNKTFQPMAIIRQLEWPWIRREAWHPSYWDLNYYMVMLSSVGAYSILETLRISN